MKNELVELTNETALTVFTVDNGLDPYVQQVKDEVENFVHDLSTAAGRKRSASLAAKVAKMKVKLDGMGKDLVAEWKSNSKKVDGARKKMRDELDEIKAIARQPLTDWETEQEEIKAKKIADDLAEAEAKEKNILWDFALMELKVFNIEFAAKEEERLAYELSCELAEQERLKQAQIDNDLRVANEATAKAEHLAQQAVDDAQAAERKAIDDKIRSDNELLEAQAREKLLNEQAAQNKLNADWLAYITEAYEHNDYIDDQKVLKLQAEAAEQSRLAAIESERLAGIERQRLEEQRLKDEAQAREDNQDHKRKINNSILSILIDNGVPEVHAKKMVVLAAKRELPNLVINY